MLDVGRIEVPAGRLARIPAIATLMNMNRMDPWRGIGNADVRFDATLGAGKHGLAADLRAGCRPAN